MSDSSDCVAFLHCKIALLAPRDLIVNIKDADIYVRRKVQYKVNNIVSHAANNEQDSTSQIQCFILASIMSKYIGIISVPPVRI